jgi:hypothetical protein
MLSSLPFPLSQGIEFLFIANLVLAAIQPKQGGA